MSYFTVSARETKHITLLFLNEFHKTRLESSLRMQFI